MQTITDIAKEIVAREGGYVNDPDDPGGATKYGVTIGTMRRLGLDLDGNDRIDTADVKQLSVAQAVDIFIQDYFKRPKLDRLPKAIQASVFDMYVNAGSNAVRILQKLLNEIGFDLSVDGKIGPQTASAAHKAQKMMPNHFADAYGIERRNYYYALADRRASSRKYAIRRDGGKGGWIKRAEEFISPKYHLSLVEHKKRTAQWV